MSKPLTVPIPFPGERAEDYVARVQAVVDAERRRIVEAIAAWTEDPLEQAKRRMGSNRGLSGMAACIRKKDWGK